MLHSHLRPMSFGEILDSAFAVYRRHFVTFAVTTLIPLAPIGVVTALIVRSVVSGGGTPEQAALTTFPVTMLATVGLLVMWAALARQVEQAWTGGEVSVGDGYRVGVRAFFPLLGATILSYLLMLVAFVGFGIVAALLVGIVAGVAAASGAGVEAGAGAAVIAGVVGLIVGVVALAVALLLFSALFGVLPAVVVERAGPIEAIRRSLALTKGARARVAGVVVVSTVIVFLPALAVSFMTGGLAGMFDPGKVPTAGAMITQQVASSIVGALTTPFLVAAFVLLYFDRRVRTEALDVKLATDALPSL